MNMSKRSLLASICAVGALHERAPIAIAQLFGVPTAAASEACSPTTNAPNTYVVRSDRQPRNGGCMLHDGSVVYGPEAFS
jgi:hypothetical protein